MVASTQSPEKELRFTRSNQAVVFWLATSFFGTVAIILAVTAFYRETNPLLPHPGWSLAPLAVAIILARLAWRLTRHAYLILTPLGIEIFPFLRPEQDMTMISWHEINAAEVNAAHIRLTLHRDAAKTSGIHLSLRPIRAYRRELLIKAVAGRCRLVD